jgi:hypothetical protein
MLAGWIFTMGMSSSARASRMAMLVWELGGRINPYPFTRAQRLLNPVDDSAFVIGLKVSVSIRPDQHFSWASSWVLMSSMTFMNANRFSLA